MRTIWVSLTILAVGFAVRVVPRFEKTNLASRDLWTWDVPKRWPISFRKPDGGDPKDPQGYCTRNEKCCGQRQSPVDLVFDNMKLMRSREIKFVNYDTEVYQLEMANYGYNMTIWVDRTVKKKEKAYMTGGDLFDEYTLDEVQMYWGKTDKDGSEHRIQNKTFAGEIRLIHYKKDYKNYRTARSYSDGLAIYAILLEAVDGLPEPYELIFKNVTEIQDGDMGESVNMTDLNFSYDMFLPVNASKFFYRYHGSNPTPDDCSENVVWTVCQYTKPISKDTLKKFRDLVKNGTESLVKSLKDTPQLSRPVQPLNDRTVYWRKPRPTSVNSGRTIYSPSSSFATSSALCIFSVLLHRLMSL